MVKRYVFLCRRITEKHCMEQKVFGLADKYLPVVNKIRKGDKLFLHNFDSNTLYGVFKAASDGAEKISPWACGGRYPAQVKVSIDVDQIREISNAHQRL